ncbi:MAG: triphosphoribosyl-dephospho-CoA synthase [Candidatus Thiodiazotropha sp.]|nr:triphosphoribosyl-dephospho-CoA synthase [Candidatus Thiodiazotropha sp. (ex Lucina pensylvanica)]MBT3061496.1 triphosphoribosyl-dephospho-CoA synthase [Candidatus Thiodiazotropha sp. (ex Lucina pensylvanica)]MBV2094961.1 triphosphoribosyl-dephospho-CoA synthase [Candidatus Thiodiazotropha sp. (ex Codakia orbicularis)]PUB76983.1 MAG: triphosphoribosyl-dephospho-CoA synthase [gamma proteobacterium symbiont of Ctena orbiculata]
MTDSRARHEELRSQIATAYRQACLCELDALKPGNVHRFSDGHRMTLEDFITSATVTAEPLTLPGLGLGERIYRAVAATREAVGCNTNLGILMLCAPLIHALLEESRPNNALHDRLCHLLLKTDSDQVGWLFRAIQLAAPGGLGQSDKYDVAEAPRASLIEVMEHAAERDLVARQYATGFADLFGFALPLLHDYQARWQNEWAITALFLSLLARYPDSHIRRKNGLYKAVATSLHGAELLKELEKAELPEHYHLRLLQADNEFKREGINPGTSADLTVATLFISYLEQILPAFGLNTGYTRVRDSRPEEVGIQS